MILPPLDKIIHEQTRLRILVYLSSSDVVWNSFQDVRKALSMTAGNLSIQLGKLEEENLVITRKKINGSRIKTEISITKIGKVSLSDYLLELEKLVNAFREEDNSEID